MLCSTLSLWGLWGTLSVHCPEQFLHPDLTSKKTTYPRRVSNLHYNEKSLWQRISRPHIQSEISPSRFWKSPLFPHCRQNCNSCQQNFRAILGASRHEIISRYSPSSVSKESFWAQQALFEQILRAEQKNHVIKLKQKLQHHQHTYMWSVLLYWLIYASVNPNARASLRLVIGTEEATSMVHLSELPLFTYSPRTCLEETPFSSAVSPQDWCFLW